MKIMGTKKKSTRDEAYVIDLCNVVLKLIALRQYRFDFLRGDSGRLLPVDAYYQSLGLVVEYHERQHSEPVKFFDRKPTVSGIPRGEQRKKYDKLRRKLIPANGLILIVINYTSFDCTARKRIIRDRTRDIGVIRRLLKNLLKPKKRRR